jgi:DNA-binding beta-propeller fold protein YncE
LKTLVPLPAAGYGTASTRDGRWLLVAIPSINKVAVVDMRSLKVSRTIDTPRSPQEILVRPDGLVAYVSCNRDKQVVAIDLTQWRIQSLIDAGAGADGLAWAGN